jgi:hypothetical protein
MTRPSPSLAGLRWRLLVTGLVAALALAACGGSSSQTQGPGGTRGPGETQGPGDTQEPGSTDEPIAGDGTEAFNAATTALDALDSYAFRVEISSTTVTNGTTSTSHSVMSGVVVHSPEEANSLIQEELDADGNVTSSSGIIVIGEEAWIGDGAGGWTLIPAAQAAAFIQSMASFRPEQMFGLYFAGIGGNFSEVGSESKNGIDSTHYQGDEEIGAILGAVAGFQGEWSSDVWIANDGGFLVHSEAGADAAAGPEAGSFLIVVDITDPNDAGPIEPPA